MVKYILKIENKKKQLIYNCNVIINEQNKNLIIFKSSISKYFEKNQYLNFEKIRIDHMHLKNGNQIDF